MVILDMMIEDIHFDRLDDPFCLAQKLRVNLSDIAAMGAKPYGYTLPKLNQIMVKEFAGAWQNAKKFNLKLFGGA